MGDLNENESLICFMNRQKISKILGKAISLIFKFVTNWKDNNWLNYSGIEKSDTKYCLIGCDPLNDHIISDLSSLKSANARQIIYNQFGIPYNLRSNYSLNLRDYIIKD